MKPATFYHQLYNPKTKPQPHHTNIEWPERLASVVLGSKIALTGIFRIFKHPIRSTLRLVAGGYLVQRGVTGYCPLYAKIGMAAIEPVNVNIKYTFTVNRPRQDVYAFWRRLENLPLFMTHLENIEVISEKLSHWELKTPGNLAKISWDAEIVKDEVGSFIGWQSLPGSTIDNAGKVEFEDAPGGLGTIVKVVISYLPPVADLGAGIARLLNPIFEKVVREDVLNFKEYIELTHEREQRLNY